MLLPYSIKLNLFINSDKSKNEERKYPNEDESGKF